MFFGELPVEECHDCILAHSIPIKDGWLRKGITLSETDIETIGNEGIANIMVARLDANDVSEDEAATMLGHLLVSDQVSQSEAATGRVNLFSQCHGVMCVDRHAVDHLNSVTEDIALSTLENNTIVRPGQMIATLKIIPFGVARSSVKCGVSLINQCNAPLLKVAPFSSKKILLVQTKFPRTPQKLLDKMRDVTEARMRYVSGSTLKETRCSHDISSVVKALNSARGKKFDLILLAGPSAIADRRDILPAALVEAGGAIEHLGMPVDPGNLLMLGSLSGVPVVGLPGCARSPKLNGFDWVLRRLVSGLPVGKLELQSMGVGGLLKDTPERGAPRVRGQRKNERHRLMIDAVVLAAGMSRRMANVNKLTAKVNGTPMLTTVLENLRRSHVRNIVVVTGYEADRIDALVTGERESSVLNPAYADGLSSSLKCGISSLSPDCDGVIVCLGDMPYVGEKTIDDMLNAFCPSSGARICVPTYQGKRGNPVVMSSDFFPQIMDLTGDVGAKSMIASYPEDIVEVEVESLSVLSDLDRPGDFQ